MANDDYNVLFTFWLTSRAVHGLLDEALAPAGLTADEFGIYSVLTRSDTMTPSELARWMSAPPTTGTGCPAKAGPSGTSAVACCSPSTSSS